MTKIEFITQLMAIVVGITMGRHDGPAIKVFHEKGWAGKRENWWFHQTNNLTKFLFILLLAIAAAPDVRSMVFVGFTSALWIHLYFDIATGVWGHANDLFYLGHNDWNGKLWRGLFKSNPGKWKAFVLTVILISLNLIKAFVI